MNDAAATQVVLVVDDDDTLRRTVRTTLTNAGYAVIEAASGLEGLRHARALPDLIMLDVRLPDMNGLEVSRRLRADPLTASIPQLMLSGVDVSSDDRSTGLEAGADAYLTKPVHLRELLAVATALLRMRGAQLALGAADARYRRLLERARDIVFVLAPDGRLTSLNAAFEATLGWRREEWLERPFTTLLHPEEIATALGFLDDVMVGRTPPPLELRILSKFGHYITAEFTASAETAPDGSAVVLGIGRDVTARTVSEERLRQSERLSTLGELIAGISHELNNPLSVIAGYAQMLASDPDVPARLRVRIDRINEGAGRVARLVRSLLSFARRRTPVRVLVSLAETAERALDLMNYRLRLGDVAVVVDIPADIPKIAVDPDQLLQVFINIMTNAAGAMEASEGPRRLTIRAVSRERGVRLEFADTGPGVAPELRERIFEPFFTTKPPDEGSGLGLSLCADLVGAHGGTIAVQGAPGAGATFVVNLPLGEETLPIPRTRPPRRERARILVADDEPAVLAFLEDALRLSGHTVDVVTDGQAALQAIERGEAYDLLFLDLRMPRLDGWDVYTRILQQTPALAGRVVFMTSDLSSAAVQTRLDASRRPSLAKPFTLEELDRLLRRLLSR